MKSMFARIGRLVRKQRIVAHGRSAIANALIADLAVSAVGGYLVTHLPFFALALFLGALAAGCALVCHLVDETRTDPLTGAANRRGFDLAFDDELDRAQRWNHPLTLVLFDLDDLKQLNDRYGHAAGDAALRAIVNGARPLLRDAADRIGRRGGDEFSLLLPEMPADQAFVVVERLRQMIERALRPCGGTASFGMATAPDDACDKEGLYAEADRALYVAKQTKNTIVYVGWIG